jgi:hypothetical protein
VGSGLRKMEENIKMGAELYGQNCQNSIKGKNWPTNGQNLMLSKTLLKMCHEKD